MKLIDRIAFQRLLSMVFDFILTVLKLFVPQHKTEDKKIWRPRWRRDR